MREPRGDAGQATVELALGLPIVVLALVAVLNLGLLVRDRVLVTHAAREAARAAAVEPDPAAAEQAAKAAGTLDPGRLEVAVGDRGRRGGRVTVTVSYRFRVKLPLISMAILDVQLKDQASMRVER